MASTGSDVEKGKNMGQEDFTYLPPPREVFYREEGVKEKFIRKTKENPFVPLGVLITTFALSYGLWQCRDYNFRTELWTLADEDRQQTNVTENDEIENFWPGLHCCSSLGWCGIWQRRQEVNGIKDLLRRSL